MTPHRFSAAIYLAQQRMNENEARRFGTNRAAYHADKGGAESFLSGLLRE